MSALVDEDKIAGLLDQLDKGSLKELLIRGRDDNTSNDNWVQGRITVDGLNFKVTYEDNDVEIYPTENDIEDEEKNLLREFGCNFIQVRERGPVENLYKVAPLAGFRGDSDDFTMTISTRDTDNFQVLMTSEGDIAFGRNWSDTHLKLSCNGFWIMSVKLMGEDTCIVCSPLVLMYNFKEVNVLVLTGRADGEKLSFDSIKESTRLVTFDSDTKMYLMSSLKGKELPDRLTGYEFEVASLMGAASTLVQAAATVKERLIRAEVDELAEQFSIYPDARSLTNNAFSVKDENISSTPRGIPQKHAQNKPPPVIELEAAQEKDALPPPPHLEDETKTATRKSSRRATGVSTSASERNIQSLETEIAALQKQNAKYKDESKSKNAAYTKKVQKLKEANSEVKSLKAALAKAHGASNQNDELESGARKIAKRRSRPSQKAEEAITLLNQENRPELAKLLSQIIPADGQLNAEEASDQYLQQKKKPRLHNTTGDVAVILAASTFLKKIGLSCIGDDLSEWCELNGSKLSEHASERQAISMDDCKAMIAEALSTPGRFGPSYEAGGYTSMGPSPQSATGFISPHAGIAQPGTIPFYQQIMGQQQQIQQMQQIQPQQMMGQQQQIQQMQPQQMMGGMPQQRIIYY